MELGQDIVLEQGLLNVYITSWASWMSCVKDKCFVWALMLVWLPETHACCIKRSPGFEVPLMVPLLRKAVLTDARHNWQKAARLWKDGQLVKAKKNLVHSIRYLRFGLQVLQHGKVVDYTDGNDVWESVMMANGEQDWNQWSAPYLVIYKGLVEKMELHHVKPIEVDPSLDKRHQVLVYLRTHGRGAFERDWCAVTRDVQDTTLVMLSVEKRNAPCGFSIARNCKLVVVQSDWSLVVAMSQGHILEHRSKYVVDFPWQTPSSDWRVTQKLASAGDFLLFWSSGRWRAVGVHHSEEFFFEKFAGWDLPPREEGNSGVSYSFLLGAKDGLLYHYGDGGGAGAAPPPTSWRCVPLAECGATTREQLIHYANAMDPFSQCEGLVIHHPTQYSYGVYIDCDAAEAIASISERVHAAEKDANDVLMLRVLRCDVHGTHRTKCNAHFAAGPYRDSWVRVRNAYDKWIDQVASEYDRHNVADLPERECIRLFKTHEYGKAMQVMRFSLVGDGTTEKVRLFALCATSIQFRLIIRWVLGEHHVVK